MPILRSIIESRGFQNFVVAAILVNAAVLGLQSIKSLPPALASLLHIIDALCLVVFTVEIALKLAVVRLGFFRSGWNIFDLAVVAISLAPDSGGLSVLRALRVLRLMRLVSAVPSLRRVVTGMFSALPGVGSVGGVLLVMFYVAAIMGNSFFGESVPERFGDLPITFLTLFKMMTLEGWPDIADEVMQHHPYAWAFFIPFIIMTTFTTLNLLFGIIVNAMEEAKEEEAREKLAAQGIEVTEESSEMRLAKIESEVREMNEKLEQIRLAVLADRAAPAREERQPVPA
ncbi:ion transporter [Azospirillum sp. SYSU D00513]|uniref:ion transporter n=1 Tax=Azospirillum sp. SYSU D00513 TaxID=2812561 RepID=UPI001A968087|nr:ion transporter [Azospirillum sp. SYSU D00513]